MQKINNKITAISLLNYIYIITTILWLPIQKTFLQFDGKARTLFFLTIIVMIVNSQYNSFRKFAFSRPAVIWLIWCIYAIINATVQGYSVDLPMGYYFVLKILSPYVIMVTASYEFSKNENRFLKYMLGTFVIYSIIGFYFMDNFYIAMQEGRSANNTLGNLLALNTVFISFYAALLCNNKVISINAFYLFLAFAGTIITLSATRKAFGAVVIIYAFYLFSQIKPTLSNVIKYLIIFIIIYIGIDFIINNTFIGERFTKIEESSEMLSDTDNPFLKMLGDRVFFYITGWDVFTNNPLCGIGLSNFGVYTKTNIVIHTEYIVQLCECGIVGTFLYVLFYSSIISNIFKYHKSLPLEKSSSMIVFSAILAILFISLTAWTYDFPFYFAVLGTVIGYTKKQNTIFPKQA